MYDLNAMKKCLIDYIWPQLSHLDQVNTAELGEAIDMIKDLEEAIYYCTITKAMNEQPHDRMYYDEKYKKHHHKEYPMPQEEWQEDYQPHSAKQWRMYMTAKHSGHDKTHKMNELEKYMKELSDDIIQMIDGATQEEKELLSTKLNGLAARIDG